MLRRDYTRYRSRLVLEPGEEHFLQRLAGLSRFAYNWALDLQAQQLAGGLPLLDVKELEARFWKEAGKPGNEWLKELPSDVWRNALKHLHRAYDLYDRQHLQNTNKGYHRNPPQRKRRGHSKTSFLLSRFTVDTRTGPSGRRRTTVIDGHGHRYILHRTDAMPEHLGRPYLATVKELDGAWFITLSYREPTVIIRPQGEPIGVDCGFKQMAVDSEGVRYDLRDLPRREHERLLRLRRALRTKRPGSRSHRRLRADIDRLRYRRRRIEWDCHHQASAHILRTSLPATERPARVVVDHLNLTSIARSSQTLDEAVRTQSLFQLILKLRHKAQRQGTELVEANQWYPSSKTCSGCGHIDHELRLSTRTYRCPRCGLVLDRDENAARNLRDYETDWLAVINGKERRFLEAELDRHPEPVMRSEPVPTAAPATIPEGLDEELEALARRRRRKVNSPIGQGAYDRDDLSR